MGPVAVRVTTGLFVRAVQRPPPAILWVAPA